jgi:hypothetical protein
MFVLNYFEVFMVVINVILLIYQALMIDLLLKNIYETNIITSFYF